MPSSSKGSRPISLYVFDIDRVHPGDILLTRVPFVFKDRSTWKSNVIQKFIQSSYSHAALCIDYGMFIEAIGTGVCRLAIMQTGAQDKTNVCLLRLNDKKVPDATEKARRAAECGERYVLRGYSRKGAAGVVVSFLQDPDRAATFCSQLVARAYEEASIPLVPNKKSHEIDPGDFLESPYLRNVTSETLLQLQTDTPPDFYLDDGTLFERPHHWEVETKLKVLYSNEVKKALGRLNERPASFWELEGVLASRKARNLDEAIFRGLKQFRLAEVYLEKLQTFVDVDGIDQLPRDMAEKITPGGMRDFELCADLDLTKKIMKQLEKDVTHRESEYNAYDRYTQKYKCKTFGYLRLLQERLLVLSKHGLEAKKQEFQLLLDEAQRRGLDVKGSNL